MEYMLMPDGTVEITEVFSDRPSVMRRMVMLGAVAHYWYEASNGSWWCLNNTGLLSDLDELEPDIAYEDLPDVVKLAHMLR